MHPDVENVLKNTPNSEGLLHKPIVGICSCTGIRFAMGPRNATNSLGLRGGEGVLESRRRFLKLELLEDVVQVISFSGHLHGTNNFFGHPRPVLHGEDIEHTPQGLQEVLMGGVRLLGCFRTITQGSIPF